MRDLENFFALDGGLNIDQLEPCGSEEYPLSRFHGSGLIGTKFGRIPVHIQLHAVRTTNDGIQEVFDPEFEEDFSAICTLHGEGGGAMHTIHVGGHDYVVVIWPHGE